MSPRPILKSLPPATQALSSFRVGRVHFPPTPEISATYLTHSGRSYDRSAIVVSPNDCALPERNCPERTYVLSEGKGEARLLKSVALRGLSSDEEEATPSVLSETVQRTDYFSVPLTPPSLTPDVTSSESEESDGLMSPPPFNEVELEPGHPPIPLLAPSSDDKHTHHALPAPDLQNALSFLPHPLPPARERKRSPSPHDREHKKERAHSFSGASGGFAPPRRRARSFTPEVPPDVGCLGGF